MSKKSTQHARSINWYSNVYPTYCDYLAVKASNWEYRTLGQMKGIRPSYKFIKMFRGIEIQWRLLFRKNEESM